MEVLVGIGIIVFCLWLYRCTKRSYREHKSETMLDALQGSLVGIFRSAAPGSLSSLTDDEILAVAQQTMRAFQKAAAIKGETIPGAHLLNIACFFVILYENSGKEFYASHLNYELDRYLRMGLREHYKRDILQS